MPPILLIAGASVLAALLLAQVARRHERHQTLGWTLDELVSDVMRGYDHNGDGHLSLQARSGWLELDERFRVNQSVFQASPTSRKSITTDVYSIYPLLACADELGDHDGVASQTEIAHVLAGYDANGDGMLQVAERDAYLKDFGQSRIQHYTMYVDPPKPTAPQSQRNKAPAEQPKPPAEQPQGDKQS